MSPGDPLGGAAAGSSSEPDLGAPSARFTLLPRSARDSLDPWCLRRRPCPCCPCPVPSSSASFPGDPLDKAPALAPPRPPPRGWVQAGLERRIRPVGVPCLKLSPAFQADQVAAEAQSQPLSCVVIQDLNHQTDSSGPVPRSYSLSFPRSCAAEPCSVACWQGPATSPM